ncbi:MAG: hypothetical protein JWM76_3897 [Pseudonocardiales bacterium]|nr:hypothetical protein [Pseudonocardiales bacterium]
MAERLDDSSRGSDNREAEAGAAGLRGSLDDLSRLAMSDGPDGLETLLRQVAEFAVRAIPGADGAGLTLLELDRPATMVASADFVRDVDAIQYGLGQGPCISAASEGRTMMSGSLHDERRWPRFGARVAELGVHSVLSLPLLGPAGPVGAMNVYAHARDSFDLQSIEIGELYAIPAAVSVRNAQALAQAKRVAVQLEAALRNRALIDQAIGILRSRTGSTVEEATKQLSADSESEGRTLATVAERIVSAAVSRARSRPPTE